ncbi:MAG: tetraacyldisaccharide 4'-kinase [Candidatus Goldbacteria bacterium]|nr:tetraacyldisaccharide 4'-kinase [Candidatus Goldiibacteriota bacterium]
MAIDTFWAKAVSKGKKTPAQFLFFVFLLFLSLLYYLGLLIKSLITSSGITQKKQYGRRVISVGNITVGGTGKTPFTEEIGKKIIKNGKSLLVVEKGYKRRKNKNTELVSDGEKILLNSLHAGDEAYMIARDIPGAKVMVSENKLKGIDFGIARFNPDFIMLDDGFQKRDLMEKPHNVVLVNALDPAGNGHLFPAGILREPFKNLKYADTVVITNVNLAGDYGKIVKLSEKISSLNRNIKIFEAEHNPKYFYNVINAEKEALSFIAGKKVVLFSSLGNPEGFEKTVKALGADVMLSIRFRDHHRFTKKELRGLMGLLERTGTQYLITTEKDEVKINRKFITDKRLYALKIGMLIKNSKELEKRLKIG